MTRRRSRPQTYEAIVRDRARAPGGKLGSHTVRVTIPDAIDEDVLFGALRDNLSLHAIAAVVSCLRINRTNNGDVDRQVHWFGEELVKLLGGDEEQNRLAEQLGL